MSCSCSETSHLIIVIVQICKIVFGLREKTFIKFTLDKKI